MKGQWRHLPAPARPIAAATSDAVAAARERDAQAFTEAAAHLGALEESQVGLILGTAIRLLMEDQHPDGLDGDDVRELLTTCVRRSALGARPVEGYLNRAIDEIERTQLND